MKKRKSKRQKNKEKNQWKSAGDTLIWAPTWKGRKGWFKRLKDIQEEIDNKTEVLEPKQIKRRVKPHSNETI